MNIWTDKQIVCVCFIFFIFLFFLSFFSFSFRYIYRDEAQTKMRALKERAERDSQQYSHELKKLQRALDHQNHLRAFVATISAGEEDETAQRRPEGEIVRVGLVVVRFLGSVLRGMDRECLSVVAGMRCNNY